jgi:hypothetical protein
MDATPAAPAEAAVSDPGYAVMVRIRVGDRWTWTTWMRFETYAEAAAHAREGNKVVRFASEGSKAKRLPNLRSESSMHTVSISTQNLFLK